MKALIRRALSARGYRLQSTRYVPRQLLDPRNLRALELADVMSRRMFERGPELTFIQVGAYDGVTADPLYDYIGKYRWRGVMMEPQPQAARQLRERYSGNDRITILEAALDGQRRRRALFTVESTVAPAWAAGMASFDRLHIEKHESLIPGVTRMIREITVECVVFEDVLAALPSEHLDLLQIDAEGADAYLLSLFPFDRIKPAIIHWETKNLSVAEREDCLGRLATLGYRFAVSGAEDMIAVLPHA